MSLVLLGSVGGAMRACVVTSFDNLLAVSDTQQLVSRVLLAMACAPLSENPQMMQQGFGLAFDRFRSALAEFLVQPRHADTPRSKEGACSCSIHACSRCTPLCIIP